MSTSGTKYQCLKNVYGVEMTFVVRCLFVVELIVNDKYPISMSKKCLWSDVEMTYVIRCLLDVEFRL